jgi:sterol desaturase/sphingolipid hydroxylase (fatty acid hydroxylase superfamily)
LDILLQPFVTFWMQLNSPSNRWFFGYLAASVLIAFVIYLWHARHDPELREHGFIPFAFPKDVWRHRGTRVDIAFYFTNKLLFAAALASMFIIAEGARDAVLSLLAWAGIAKGLLSGLPMSMMVLTSTLILILAFDFGLWLGHWLFHRIPVLWEFHKVHHSAEVMTPFTAGRMHPVEEFFDYGLTGVLNGIAFAIVITLFGEAYVLQLFQVNIVLIVFYALGFHLRHSHVWMPYTGVWGAIFVSPAHHQLHHSLDRDHWDKNMGFIFAFWDRWFGTLVVPEARQKVAFGVNGVEEGDYDTVWKLYSVPFIKAWGLLRGERRSMDPLPAPEQRKLHPAE